MLRKINIKCFIFLLLFVTLFISELFGIFGLSYFDEVLGLISIVYLLYSILMKKAKEISVLIYLFLIIIMIGVLGNAFNEKSDISFIDIILDIFMFLKPYLFLGATYCFLKGVEKKEILFFSNVFCKVVIFIVFIFAVIYMLRNNIYFTISKNHFSFYSGFTGAIANLIIVSILFVSIERRKVNIIYFLMSAFIIFMSGSSLGLLGILIVFFFNYIFQYIRFKWYYFLPVIAIAIVLSWSEFSSYILNYETARSKMYQYAFYTANNFAPIGSGFGLYGSYVAAHNYSYLYIEYGFQSVWGLTSSSLNSNNFLFDTYYPMIIGQFGYLGLLLFVFLIIYCGIRLYKLYSMKQISISCITLFIYIVVMGIGFNIGGAEGCIIMSSLGLLLASKKHENTYFTY